MNFVKSLKKEMTSFLGKKGRRIELIMYSFAVVFVIVAPIYLFVCSAALAEYLAAFVIGDVKLDEASLNIIITTINTVAGAIAISSVIFVTFPVLHGYFLSSYRLYRDGAAGDSVCIGQVKNSYMRSLVSGAAIGGIALICVLPFIAIVNAATVFANHNDTKIAALVSYLFIPILFVGLVLGFLIFLLFRAWFLFGYYSSKGKNFKESMLLSFKMMKTERARRMYKDYIKSFLPSLLLALPTVMVLFFIDTLPKMMLTYYRLADSLEYGEQA